MKISDFKSEGELQKMKIADIKKHVREFNDHYAIKGYSKLNKDQLINTVLTAQTRLRNAVKAKRAKAEPKAEPKASPLSKMTKAELLKLLPESLRRGEVAKQKKSKLIELVNELRNKEFVGKNVGKKTKKNPVPEEPFDHFWKLVNERAATRTRPIVGGSLMAVRKDEMLKILNSTMPTMWDNRHSLFLHPETEGEDKGTLLIISEGRAGNEIPFTRGERNVLLKGVTAHIKGKDTERNKHADSLIDSIASIEERRGDDRL